MFIMFLNDMAGVLLYLTVIAMGPQLRKDAKRRKDCEKTAKTAKRLRKDAAHLRRGSTNAVAVHCDLMSTLTVKKDVVLRNKQNKQCFINMVSEKLKKAGCDNIHATGDADVLIVQSAVSVTATRDTVVIADNTQTF